MSMPIFGGVSTSVGGRLTGAGEAGWRRFAGSEIEATANDEAVAGKRRRYFLNGAQASSLLVRVGEGAPPDFLVDDVGDFSPA